MDKVIYAKFSKERKKEFQLLTTIVEDRGYKKVIKKSFGKDATAHVSAMHKHCNELKCIFKKEKKIRICDCNLLDDGSVSFPYLEGLSAEEWIGKKIRLNKLKEVYQFLEEYYKLLKGLSKGKGFQQTKEYIKIFGERNLPEQLECCNIANIDLIFSNIIIVGSIWNVIDYEWIFYFPVPVHFIFYRAVKSSLSISLLKEEKVNYIFSKFGITELEQEEYKKMEESFQRYTKDGQEQLTELYKKFPVISANINNIDINKVYHPFQCKVKNSNVEKIVKNFKTMNRENKVFIDLKDYVQYNQIVISLSNPYSIVKIKAIEAWDGMDCHEIYVLSHNAELNILDDYYFTEEYPWLMITNNKFEKISIDYCVIRDNDTMVKQIVQYIYNEQKEKREIQELIEEKRKLEQEIVDLDKRIQDMENTSILKMYILKKLKKGNKS